MTRIGLAIAAPIHRHGRAGPRTSPGGAHVPDQMHPNPGATLHEAPRPGHAEREEPPHGVAPRSAAASPESPDTIDPVPGAAALCARIGRGDKSAFADFYQAWFDRCVAMARALTRRDESFCLDVVQETMLRVARRIPAMDGDAQVARWMVRAVHSSAIDLLRRESRARRRDRAAARQEQAAIAADPHLAEWLRRAMAGLDEHDRAAVALRFGRGATLDQVGRATGTSADAAHGRLRRALARLRGSGP